jgi:hypothetical protein
VTVSCAVCGSEFEAKRRTAKYCGGTCRKRAHDGAKVVGIRPKASQGLVDVVTKDLVEHGVKDTAAGRQALAVAARMSSSVKDTGSSYAALSRELSRVMDEAKAGATRKADPLDELRERRERRRASA